jgi:hypothetical protein
MAINFAHIEARLQNPVVTKHNHEYEEVCSELEPLFGKLVWTLPYVKGVTEYKIREAAAIARKRGKLTFPYLRGIINRLP